MWLDWDRLAHLILQLTVLFIALHTHGSAHRYHMNSFQRLQHDILRTTFRIMPVTAVLVVIKDTSKFLSFAFCLPLPVCFFLDEALCDCKEERGIHVNLGDQGLFQSIYTHLVENRSLAAEKWSTDGFYSLSGDSLVLVIHFITALIPLPTFSSHCFVKALAYWWPLSCHFLGSRWPHALRSHPVCLNSSFAIFS